MATTLLAEARKRQSGKPPARGLPAGLSAGDLRNLFASQSKILAARSEANLPVDFRSMVNLLRVFRRLMLAEIA